MDHDQRLEAAARRLCEIRNLDPDGRALMPKNPDVMTMNATFGPRWKLMAREIEAAIERVRISQLITEFDLM